MSKDPAILLYTGDFLNGCTCLTMEERGQYITILCLQHQLGHLSEKTIRLSVGSVSVDVLKKLSKDSEGNYFNDRMEQEIGKRAKFTESRLNNGKLGGRPLKKIKPKSPENEWDEMVKYFDNSCLSCGYKFPDTDRPTKDHVIPKSMGGSDDISNLQPLCRNCNSSKCADNLIDYRLKYIDKIPVKLKTLWFPKRKPKRKLIEDINENESLIDIAWLKWKEFKKAEFNFKYKSEISENAAKMELIKLSDNKEEIAISIIEQSIANGWKGLFKLKNNGTNKGTGTTDKELAELMARKLGVTK